MMKNILLLGALVVGVAFSSTPVQAQNFNIPNFNNPSFEAFDPTDIQNQQIRCSVEGTNKILSATENVLNIKVSYDSPVVIQGQIPYVIEVNGESGQIIRQEGNVHISNTQDYLEIFPNQFILKVPFSTTDNTLVVASANIGVQDCDTATFKSIKPFAFSVPENNNQFFIPNNQNDLQANPNAEEDNNEANNENEQPPQDLLPGGIILDGNGQVQNEDDGLLFPEDAECRVVAEGQLKDDGFFVYAGIAYEGYGDPQAIRYALIAFTEDDDGELYDVSGEGNIEDSGLFLNNNASFKFAFERSEQPQNIMLEAHLNGLVCASTILRDPGTEVAGQANVEANNEDGGVNNNIEGNQQNNAAQNGGNANEVAPSNNQEDNNGSLSGEQRVIPEDASAEELLLINQLRENQGKEDTLDIQEIAESNNNAVEVESMKAISWAMISLLIIGAGILGLLGAIYIKK